MIQNKEKGKRSFQKIKLILASVLSLALFGGGIIIVLLHVSFFGNLIGIPSIVIGVALIILTYDKLNQLTLDDEM